MEIKISQRIPVPVLTLGTAFLCEASPTAEHPPNSSPATVTLPKLPARNKPKPTPWLCFKNRIIVHNCVDFALFIPVFLCFLQPWVQSQTHLQTSLEQTPHLAKQKSPRGPRLKCLLQQSQDVPFPECGQCCLRTGIWDPAKPPCVRLT